MRKVLMRPTHFTFHREGSAPRFRIQADEPAAQVRIELASRAQLLAPAQAAQRTADTYFDSVAGAPGAAGQTLQLSQGKLSYTLPALVWDRLKGNPHVFYRVSATTELPADWNAAPPRTIRSVDDGNAALGLAHYFGVPNDRLGDPWNFPDQEPLGQLAAYYREKLALLTRLHETHESAYLLRRLVGHPEYVGLPVEQRVKALLVFAACNTAARRALLQLFARVIPATASGRAATPAVRSTCLAATPRTLLDHLARFVDVDPHLDIPDGMDVLMGEAVEEVADPSFEINQGTKGTCVPTSVSWIMASFFPAEYVRLTAALLSDASTATLASGDAAALPSDTYRFDPAEQNTRVAPFLRRSWSERVFQASMMAFARPGLTYSNLLDVFADRQQGLTMDELIRMLRGLRNRPHRRVTGTGADLVDDIARRLGQPSLPVLTQMAWGGDSSHEVVSVRTEPGTVTFRNPWGGMNYRVGQALTQPTRRCVNPSAAEEAIARADLVAAIQSIVVEA